LWTCALNNTNPALNSIPSCIGNGSSAYNQVPFVLFLTPSPSESCHFPSICSIRHCTRDSAWLFIRIVAFSPRPTIIGVFLRVNSLWKLLRFLYKNTIVLLFGYHHLIAHKLYTPDQDLYSIYNLSQYGNFQMLLYILVLSQFVYQL